MTKTVTKPAPIKTSVATSERGDSLDSPHTPCPLVHPAPYRVPAPTSNPAAINAPYSALI